MSKAKQLIVLVFVSLIVASPAFAKPDGHHPSGFARHQISKLKIDKPASAAKPVTGILLPYTFATNFEDRTQIQGDVFAGDSQTQAESLDLTRFSQAGDIDDDPFASGVPAPQSKVAFVSPFLNMRSGPPNPQFFIKRLTRTLAYPQPEPPIPIIEPIGTNYAQVPQLQGASNGDISHLIGDAFSASTPVGMDYFSSSPFSSGGVDIPKASKPVLGTKSPDPHWDFKRMPIKVYVSKTVEDARHGYVQSLIYESFRDWAKASRNKVRYTATYNFREADVYFVCEDTYEDQWAEHSPEFHRGMFDRVKVAMSLKALHELAPNRLRAVCLHEAGHALGILNHSDKKGDVMSLSAPDDFHPAIALTKNDISVFCRLYKE